MDEAKLMEEAKVTKERKMRELQNGRSKLLPCDYNVLCTLVNARGFTFADIARILGYSSTFFSKVKMKGQISETAARLLKERFNILPQQYGVVGYTEGEIPKSERGSAKQKVLKRLGKAESTDSLTVKATVEFSISKAELSAIVKDAVLEAFNSL